MKSNKKRILLVLAILTMAILLSCALVACTKADTPDAPKKEFTITFDTQGGSEIAPITIRSGESLTLPKAPTKDGYVFDGWYLDSNCIEEYEDSYVVSKNITLYAKWRELVAGEEFNVIFNLNYGTDNIVEKTTENRLITYIPVRQGYRFNGWYYSDGYVEGIGYILTEKYDTTIPVAQNGLVLYAEWVDSSTDSRQLASPTISVNGTVLSWDAVKNAEKYELKFYLGKNLVKTYSTTQSSVNIDSIGIDAGTYTLKARSIGDGVSHINSAETIKHISYKVLLPVSNAKIDVESSVLTWNEANNAETYTVYIDGARFGRTYLNSLDLSKLNAGQYVIKIVAERAGYTSSNATFTLVKSRLLTPTIKIERQPNDNYSSKISWSAIYNANQYVVVVDKKEVATTSNNYYVLNDSDWGSNKKVSVSVYAKDSSADYLVSIPSEISTVTRTAKIAISHNIRNVSLVKVIGKSYSSTDNLIEDYSSADNFYVGVDFGEPKKVVAIPQNGYTWLGWYDKSGNLISTKTEYIFDVNTSSSEIVAHWASYSVALNKNDNNAGKIGFSVDDMSTQNTVSQRIVYGKEVTICASTNNGYTWLGWYKGEEKVSDEQTYTFTMSDSDIAYTAKWSKTTISVSASSAGSVSGLSSTYKVGDKVTVTAVTNNGYTWDGWYLNGEKVSSDLQYEIQITEEPLNYVATWKYYTLTTSRNISAAGTVNSYWNQKVTVGDSVELVANTNKGYTWLGWYDGETLISMETTFTYEMPAESKTLIAKWTYYTLSTQTNNSEAGTYTALSDKKVTVGDSIELIASTNDGYTWLGWYDGETLISMETTYTYVMTAESKTLAAKWTYYTLSTQANDSEAGTYTVLSDKKVTVGDSIELVVNTNKGYTWLGWYDGETMISSETTYTYVMPAENKTLIAKWTYYTLSTTNGNVDAGDITLLSYKKVAVGRSIDLIAVAKPGYSFVGWYDGEKMLSSDATYSYVMTSESKIITAKWNLTTYRIVYSFSKDNVEFESDLPTSYTIGEESIILQELNNGNYYVDYWYYEGNEGKRIKIIDVEQKRDLSIVGHVASCGLALSGTSVQGIGSCTQRDILLPRYNGETEIVTIADNAFKNNTTINHVSIPYSVTSVGSSAFYGCTGLMSVILGNSVTSIGDSAFYNCSRLVEIYNKSSLKIKIDSSDNGYIAYYAKNVYTEDGGNKLSTDKAGYVTYLDGEEKILVAYNGTNTDLIIPSGITVIAEEVFKNRYDLTSVTIPDSVTSIGEDAFYNTAWYNDQPDGLVYAGKVAYKYKGSMSSNTSIILKEGTLGIGYSAFIHCSGLTSITIPNSVTNIGDFAFKDCTGLTSVTIGNSVTSIGEYAFSGCTGLTNIIISDSVSRIGNWAFFNCNGLTSIFIPSGVNEIGEYAFYLCRNLVDVFIPNSVAGIGQYAFYNCSKLERISFDGTTAQWENITKGGFWRYNTPSDCQIICDDPELEPMTEVKLELPQGYRIGKKLYELPWLDDAFAYKFTFGNGDEDGIILNRSTLTFYDIPIDAKYIEYKAIGGVFNGVRYLDSDSRRQDLAFWHYPVTYNSKEYHLIDFLKTRFKLSKITSFKFGKLEEEHGESALRGTSFYRGIGGYLLIEGSDSNGVPKKLYVKILGKDMSLGEMFDQIPQIVYYDDLYVEEVNDTNRFELEDFKYYMQNEIIPHMQENYPKYAAFFNTCNMADYEITNYVGFGVYYDRYDHEAPMVFVDLKNSQGRTLHLEFQMDMRFGSVATWKYVREHNMLFSQVKTINPRMSEELHSYWIFPTTYFDNDGDKAIKPNEKFNQKIIDTEIDGLAYIFPSINYYFNGQERDALWVAHLSDLIIYPDRPFLSNMENKTYTFVTNCEQTIGPITGNRYTVSLPKLTREGYVFCGWYDNEAFEGRAYFDTYGSSDKSTLYAKWLPKEEPPMPDGTSLKMAYIAQSGQTYDVNITTSGQIVYFAFTPTADGTFTIQSIGGCDTYGNLYSSTQSLLATNDDGGTGNNFKLTYNMKAGTTYYVAIRLLYTSATGTFKVSFS